ncbi:transcriptional regulator, TetR family [Agromyces sp. CF514]|uniref:TetR family transcriptional regulator n=1 Tax=Agromyces sp. CF514 TaxID=1881031 RepID=UPI0008EA1F55|nr:TetR family transcriptional regulator [Agromyces sp. CF514]SFR66303.1 transcriptional regulator, TetR family [Agromyces sp. CF514]
MPDDTRERATRADARRNRDAILESASRLLVADPRANMAQVAAAAGVGRVTLYAHFASRAELVGATFERALALAEAELARLDLEVDAWTALERLVDSSWRIVDASRGVLAAAELELGPEAVRAMHDQPMRRVRALLARGRQAEVMRADQPLDWQVACFLSILHAAAAEVDAGRLDEAAAGGLIRSTIRSLLRVG